MKILNDISLRKYTTVKIGGVAENLYFPSNNDELAEITNKLTDNRFYILGGGSNLLINDEKTFNHVICLKELNSIIKKLDNEKYYVGASITLQSLIKTINQDGFGGIEYLYSVPALVGGAIVMNAGRGKKFNKSISDYIEEVQIYDVKQKKMKTISKGECEFKYRDSIFRKGELIVLGAIFRFENVSLEESERRRNERLNYVKITQDYSGYNFGSVFKKNNKIIMRIIKATRLGFKGGMRFSSKTPNWMLNTGCGTYKQAIGLINKVKKIHKLFGFEAVCEVIIWE